MEKNDQPTDNIAVVHSYYNITNRGLIVELQHHLNGLAQGTILVSQKNNSIWEIKARILFDHTIEIHKKFGNENYEFVRTSFTYSKDKDLSINNIIEKESMGIYQYFILPIGHNNIMTAKEILKITIKD